jgi:hypothetical protein
MKPSAQKIQEALHTRGFTNQVVELPDSTHTCAGATKVRLLREVELLGYRILNTPE